MFQAMGVALWWVASAWAQDEGGDAMGASVGDPSAEASSSSPHTTKITGTLLELWFYPKRSSVVGECDQIVHVQTLQMFADGKMILPGTFEKLAKKLDATASDGGFVIDTRNTNVPWYTSVGREVPSTSEKALWMDDAPFNRDSTDFPRYNEETNPTGWKDLYWSFKTFAYCSKGAQCGTWYDGVWWTMSVTAADVDAGRLGTLKVVALNLPPADASGDVRQAFERYLAVNGQKRCQ